jgi:hypothetical protein
MDSNRKTWNSGQQKLRSAFSSSNFQQAIDLFLIQHAMVHSKKMSRAEIWSFEDEIWSGLTNDIFCRIPPNGEHSIAWILWHIARIEDITMNMLVADTPQLYLQDSWDKKIKSTIHHSGNKMGAISVARLSTLLDMAVLRKYRLAVGRRTREIVEQLQPEQLKQKVDPLRLKKVLTEGAVIEEAIEIVNYWGNRTIAGLLLMPPTRHNFLHLNEALRIKLKLIR